MLFKLEDGRLHIASDDADGFLGSILPKDGITTTVDLEASWSHRDGLNIKGGAGLSTVLDIHKKAGPLRVDSLALAVKAGPQGVNGHRRRDRRREHRAGQRVGRGHRAPRWR